MTKNKIATRHKASRHDKLFFRDTRLWGFTETHFARFLSLRRNVVTEAICLQVASNLLANRSPHCVRDDKLLTDGRVVLKDSSP